MKDKKQVTIFGGTGFVGRYVIDRLCDRGFTVRVATRQPASAYFLRTSGVVGQVVPVTCNIFDETSVMQVVAGSHYVINLIGVVVEKGKQTFDALHHQFPAHLAKIARANKVERLIHVSALGASKDAASIYAKTKAAGEQELLANFSQTVVLRPSIIFGPEDSFFNRFAKMAQILPFLPLIGGGKTRFQPVYVGDVADAVVKAMTTTENVDGKTFELGGDDTYSFKELMQKIFDLTCLHSQFVTVPFGIAKIKGAFLQRLPGQLLTVDQVRSLSSDSVLSGTKPGLRDLGINPTPLDAILPTYMERYRPGGRFANRRTA